MSSKASISPAESVVTRLLLFRPATVERRLAEIEAARGREGAPTPNTWQISLGVLRMLHRVAFRSETVGTSQGNPVRPTWRARVLQFRPLRSPFLLRERAIAPLDLSGLLSSPERVVNHLLGAHHDGNQFSYDLEMLAATPERLEETIARTRAVLERNDARGRWLRDLCVYEGYHESLLAACVRARGGDYGLTASERGNPDISFDAYLAWCAAQPTTFEETLTLARAGLYHPMHGRLDRPWSGADDEHGASAGSSAPTA